MKRWIWREPILVKDEESLADAVGRMIDRRIHRLYQVDENRKPVKVISATDVIALFVKELQEAPETQ